MQVDRFFFITLYPARNPFSSLSSEEGRTRDAFLAGEYGEIAFVPVGGLA